RSEKFVPLPPKETVKAALATLGLVDENDTSISSTNLANSTPFENEVPLTAHMCKLENLSPEPTKSLIPPSRELNNDDTANKSLSKINVQHPAEKPVATADATQSIDVSESAEKLGNQPKPADAEKVQETIIEEEVRKFGIKYLGDVPLDELGGLMLIWMLMRAPLTQIMQEVDSDLESMHGDENESLSEFEADESNDDDPLPKFDKRVKKTLNAEIPKLLIKLLNNAFNLLNKKERIRFVSLQKLLAKTIKIKVGKYVMRSVRKEVTVVRELLKYYVTQLDKNDVNLRELVDLIRDLVVLIDSTSASAKATPEGGGRSLLKKT
ncbi:hypothetical protein Tco_0886930, partial [Tanacetum coccineum]